MYFRRTKKIKKPHLFLSYAWQTRATANRIYFDLIRSGIDVWKDDRTAEKGDVLWQTISKAIKESDYFLLMDSPYARTHSEWVKRECLLAKELEGQGKLKIIIGLAENHKSTHGEKEIFEGQNEILFFDFSELTPYDPEGKYNGTIDDLCKFFDKEFVPWTKIPRDQDFEKELSQIPHLSANEKELLVKDYELFRARYLKKFPTSESRLVNLIADCERLNVTILSPYLALGIMQADAGNYAFARDTFDKAMKMAPNDPRVHLGLGGAHFYLGDYLKAIELYQKTIKLIQKSKNYNHKRHLPDVNRNLIEAFLESGQYEAAMKTYLLLDDKQRELPEVKFALGRIYLFQNEADSAIKVFEALYAIRDAENADFWMELATCYHRFGATERAIQILEQGAKECLDTSQINIQLAHLYFGLNRTFDAIGVYELLKSEQPGSLQINAELATLYFLAIQENRYNGQINRFDLNQKISECSRICYDFQASNSEEYYLIGQVYYINRLFRKAEYFYNQSFVLSEGGHAKPYYDAFIVL